MTQFQSIPDTAYGIIHQDCFDSEWDEVAEQVRRIGYAVLDSDYTPQQLLEISEAFNRARKHYVALHGASRLRSLNELHTIRALLTHGDPLFLSLALNPNLLAVLKRLITGKFILNQQNGIINPPGEGYNQAAWHRDLPYQHYVSSTPLAVNALFCIDDFTLENGSTFVLPASHKAAYLPSEHYIRKNAVQVQAKAGSYLLLDCMLFHSGGFNGSTQERRAVNHVYSIPFFKQQINLPGNMRADLPLNDEEKEWLGFNYQEPASIERYLSMRSTKER